VNQDHDRLVTNNLSQ